MPTETVSGPGWRQEGGPYPRFLMWVAETQELEPPALPPRELVGSWARSGADSLTQAVGYKLQVFQVAS